jgi:hypothetical protein
VAMVSSSWSYLAKAGLWRVGGTMTREWRHATLGLPKGTGSFIITRW